jgi:ATP-binding cassette subfamily B protein
VTGGLPGVDRRVLARRPRSGLLQAFWPGWRLTIGLACTITIATVLPVLAPHYTRRFVDRAIAGADVHDLWILAVSYVVLAVGGLAARSLTGWLANGAAWDGTNRLRERAAAHTLALGLPYLSRHSPGELIERIDGDVLAIGDYAVTLLMDVVVSVLLLVGVIISIFFIDIRLGVAATVFCLLLGWLMFKGQGLALPAEMRSRARTAVLLGTVEETMSGLEDVRANGAGEHAVGRFYRASREVYRADRRSGLVGTTVVAGTSVAFTIGTALLLGVVSWLLSRGSLTVGTAVLLFQYTLLVRAPFEQLVEQIRGYQGALAGMGRVRELLAQCADPPPPERPRELPAAGPLDVVIDNVAYRYDDASTNTISDLTISLRAGETLGLIGRTGSGKTTITRLLLRIYDPTGGSIQLSGVDLRDVDPESLHRRVAMVTQDVQLFDASIRDNLTLFRAGTDDERLRHVLDEVGLGAWFGRQPEGLDSHADGMSAGEAQLLTFARVLLADPGLVILDEPSSRLDPASQALIAAATDRLLVGRTGIIIAHRLSTLSGVDQVAILRDGHVVEQGRRTDLLANPDSETTALFTRARVRR